MQTLATEIETYEREKAGLQKTSAGKFVLIKAESIVGTFDTFEAAAEQGLKRFGQDPFLVREVGKDTADIPPAVLYGITNADLPHTIYN